MNAGNIRFDVAVVGAGVAGSAAAAVCARHGLKTVLIERGRFPGSKNLFGGTVYTHSLESVYPDLWTRKPPLERPVTEAGYWLLGKDSVTRIVTQGGVLEKQPADAYVALRSKFDLWWAEQAQKEGAFLLPKTAVTDLIRDGRGAVKGVRTNRPEGDIAANVVIICEGVNNLLTRRLGLIGHDLRPREVALAVKQLISLPAEEIQKRFNLADRNHGAAFSVMGDATLGLPGMGFLYTGGESLSIGLGVSLFDLAQSGLTPYSILQRFLAHPVIAPLIAGGQLMEYGGHLIPEGGWNDLPRLSTDGALVAGDAAAMVNALYWEGTNMAITAGKLAAETAVEAHRKSDFTDRSLSSYRDRLKESFVLKDLRHHRGFTGLLNNRPQIMSLYPGLVNEAVTRMFSSYGKPKKQMFKELTAMVRKKRGLLGVASDLVAVARNVLGI